MIERLIPQNSSGVLKFLLTVATLHFVIQLSLLTKSIEHLTTLVMIDDTYYYLQTAWNVKVLGFATFDGLHATNGVQLLWFLMITVIAFFANTKELLLQLTFVSCALLNVLCYLVIGKIGNLLKSPLLAVLMATFWFLQTFYIKIYLFGMENALHALVFWVVLWQMLVFLIHIPNNRNLLALTIVLTLNGWARLDSALFSVMIYLYCLAMWIYSSPNFTTQTRSAMTSFWQKNGKVIASSILLAGSGFMLQLAAFWLMGGSIFPVSALVKASAGSWGWKDQSLEQLIKNLILTIPPDILPSELPSTLLGAIALMALLTVIGAYLAKWPPPPAPPPILGEGSSSPPSVLGEGLGVGAGHQMFRHVWICLLISLIAYNLVIVLSGAHYQGYFTWYRSPLYIFWMITFSLALKTVIDMIMNMITTGRQNKRVTHLYHSAIVASILLIIIVSGVRYFRSELNQDIVPHHLYSVRYNAALWLAENTPPNTIYAAWNAGQLGYFSERKVINLDGLINSIEYYENVLEGTTSLDQYLQENIVDYIVDYRDYDPTPRLPLVHAFPRAGKRWLRMWEVPREEP